MNNLTTTNKLKSEEMLTALKTLAEAASTVNKLWDETDTDTDLTLADGYDLPTDFDAVTSALCCWHDCYKKSLDPEIYAVTIFERHINDYIGKMPIGGYTDREYSSVSITVGGQTLVTYDHAAMINGILEALRYFKAEY